LPDGLFSNQKSQFGSILEGLEIENLGIFYDHLVYFTAIGNILRPFGLFCGHLVYFPRFGMLYDEKSGNPACFAGFHSIHLQRGSFGCSPSLLRGNSGPGK
jgi:hypothetical protein